MCIGEPCGTQVAHHSIQKQTKGATHETPQSGARGKRVYLRQKSVDKYGQEPGCARCIGTGHHTEECRERIENLASRDCRARRTKEVEGGEGPGSVDEVEFVETTNVVNELLCETPELNLGNCRVALSTKFPDDKFQARRNAEACSRVRFVALDGLRNFLGQHIP